MIFRLAQNDFKMISVCILIVCRIWMAVPDILRFMPSG
jgi:hypothetical protein